MIVDGTEEFVGSDGRRLRKAISSAAQSQKADVSASLAPRDPSNSDAITLTIRASSFPNDTRSPHVDVLLPSQKTTCKSKCRAAKTQANH